MHRILIIGLAAGMVAGVVACGDETAGRDAAAQTSVAQAPALQAAPAAPNGEQRRVVYVDVRQPDEWAEGRVEGAIHIPHTEMSARWAELEEHRDADIVLYCRTGRRSGIAEEILRQAGFERLHNGGALSDLAQQGVPVVR
jgi:phage shock protein E